MRKGIYKNDITFRQLAIESADPKIAELFGDYEGL